jgi:hypothetical protein
MPAGWRAGDVLEVLGPGQEKMLDSGFAENAFCVSKEISNPSLLRTIRRKVVPAWGKACVVNNDGDHH